MPAASPLLIRAARASDASALAGLLAELGYPCTASQALAQLTALSPADDAVFVGCVDDTAVGLIAAHFMRMLHTDARWCRITDLVVAHDHRRLGIATALLKHAEEFARAAGAARVELTCANYREPAHHFYTRHGFTERSKRFFKSLE